MSGKYVPQPDDDTSLAGVLGSAPPSAAPEGGMMVRAAVVRSRLAAPVQITAEQLLREAVERQADDVRPPRQRLVDEEELNEYRVRKRKEFEDRLRQQRTYIGTWIQYALWEAAQREFRRGRSIFERALHVDYRNVTLWTKYIEMEVKSKFINSARNLYDRVTGLLPRVDQFWFRYAHLEELLGNYAGARAIFERWMAWEPEDTPWMMYVHFEERCGELDLCRKILERYVSVKPSQTSFLKFAKFEERHKHAVRARAGYEKAIEVMPEEQLDETFYLRFGQFEEKQKEFERAKAIFEGALQRLPKNKSEALYRAYISHQKQHGTRRELEEAVVCKRRAFYEAEVKEDPTNYDVWIDFVRLEESTGDIDRIRATYERAVAAVPLVKTDKRFWQRYIYIWLNYAVFEELVVKDPNSVRPIFDRALEVIPKGFTFKKLWRLYAEFEIRQLNLDKTRLIFGQAIGMCGAIKPSLFLAYGAMELRLGQLDRCRKIYAKFIEVHSSISKSWIALINLEALAEETARCRSVCEIALDMELMDLPELIWKTYIDFEIRLGEIGRARKLFERLLQKTQHFKVFRSYAEFEYRHASSIERARGVLQRGVDHCRDGNLDVERAALLECWMGLEREHGDEKAIEKIWRSQPRKVRKKRVIQTEAGGEEMTEEYTAHIFPDDVDSQRAVANLKLLEAAKAWKKRKQTEPEQAVLA